MSQLKVTAVQSELFWEDVDANLQKFEKLLTALSQDTDVVILPEMFTTGFTMNNKELWEDMNGQTVNWMKSIAKKGGFALCGSVIIKEGEDVFNRMIWVTPDSELSYYDKRHLFSLAGEDKSYKAGSERIIFQYKGWKICPLICYDLRFPECSRNQEDYDLLIYVANWPDKRSNHWKALLKARAIENQCYTVGVNRVGSDDNGHTYSGDSSICKYDGTVLAEYSNEEVIFSSILSLGDLHSYRENFPFLSDQEILKNQLSPKTA